MDYHLIQKINSFLYNLSFGILISLCSCLSAAKGDPVSKNEIDSLRNEINKCTSDTARFAILSGYFWSYANKDPDRVKVIGELAFNEIKNSENLKALSDGYDIKGFMCREEENYDSAFFYFDRALELAKKAGYKTRIAWSFYHLGELNYLYGDFDRALSYMKNSVKYFTEVDNFSGEAGSIYYISDMYDRMGKPDSALIYNNKRFVIYKSHSDTIGMIVSDLAISTFYKNHNDSRKSLDFLKNALSQAESMKNAQPVIKVYFAIGNFFAEQKKNYPIANDYYRRVLEFAEKNKEKSLEAQLLNQIGNIYLLEGKDSLALNFNLKSLNIAKELKHRHTISNAYNSLGLVYKKLGNYSSALNCFNSCYSTGCNKCPAIAFHSTLIEIGEIYLTLNDSEQALTWFSKSLDLAEKFHSLRDISLSTLRIGNCYQKFNRQVSAEKYYLGSLRIAKEAGDKRLIKSIADTISNFYAHRNNYSSAYIYNQMSMKLGDSLNEINRQADITELEMKFEVEKIKKDNEARQAVASVEIKRQKVLKNYFTVFSILLLGFGFAVYSGYRRKKKDNRLLIDQKNQIEEKNEEIRTQVKEITSQKNQIEKISGELHESDEMKLRFFSNISHEFRTPLTLILNPAENLLKNTNGDGEVKKQLEFIYQNAQKLQDLTNQIMDLQKLDAGKLRLNLEKTDIIQYCLGIASSFESLCQKKSLTISFSSNYKSVITLFDKDKIGKILINLITNSIKFSYENSIIEVRLEVSKDVLKLTVADKGIGISGEEIDKVFNRYYQAPSDNQHLGTGIGLAYVKELVKFMKGTASIKSELNKGTTVRVTIPYDEFVLRDKTEYNTDIPVTGTKLNKKEFDPVKFIDDEVSENTVLIVEDNSELRSFISDLLKQEFKIIQASDGQEGINAAFQYIPDIIISDVMMGQVDGFELCSMLKKDERTSHIPIILLTAKDDDASSLKGYRTGADDYITKPFKNEQLKLKVKNIISTSEAARNQFDFKSLHSIDGLKLGVTDKEFMKKCIKSIEVNIDNSSFSVEKLAGLMAFSNRNFYRKIKALTNQTPAELIRIYRLNYARQLLQNTKMKVFEIAMAVGYEDTNKFRQAFRKQFGISPSESIKSLIG